MSRNGNRFLQLVPWAAASAKRRLTMNAMQKILYNDRLAAVVLADQAVIADTLSGADLRTVKAMCLYALEVAAGRQPGPYTDERALRYALHAEPEGKQ
jgi:hypothetical protein